MEIISLKQNLSLNTMINRELNQVDVVAVLQNN